MNLIKTYSILILIFFSSRGIASVEVDDKFVTYFSSIKASEVNVRKGPNTRYPIDWVYKKKGEPVEVVAKFEHWYRIRDVSGDEGWVKSVMLSKRKRTGIVNVSFPSAKNAKSVKKEDKKLYAELYYKADNRTRILAKIESSKRVDIIQCKREYCKLQVKELTGWIEKKYLWGVYLNEEFK